MFDNPYASLTQSQKQFVTGRGAALDSREWAVDYRQNLFMPLHPDSIVEFREAGEIGDDSSGGRIAAPHSSTALAINMFDHWRPIPDRGTGIGRSDVDARESGSPSAPWCRRPNRQGNGRPVIVCFWVVFNAGSSDEDRCVARAQGAVLFVKRQGGKFTPSTGVAEDAVG